MDEKISSVLKLNNIVVDKMSFERTNFCQNINDKEHMSISTEVEELAIGSRVSLAVKVERGDEFVAEVHMSAYVEIAEDHEVTKELFLKNTIAMLFPYVRSQLTLLTSQPGTMPVILPPLNINALIEEKETNPS